MVDPSNPSWLVYNRDNDGNGKFDPVYMCGPGDPEGFLYRGSRNQDGTRNGDQMTLINKLKRTGANCIYLMAIRSHGGDGGATENPFTNSNPANGIDQDILKQWETWFTEMDAHGIIIYFFFYDDNIKVSQTLNWNLDIAGNLHPQEQNFIDTIVNAFKHHKHLIWCVMEEVQEMGSDYIPHTKKIAERIKLTDAYDHVIAVHKLSGLTFSEFADDPNIDQFAIQYKKSEIRRNHYAMVTAWNHAAGRYNLNFAEPDNNYGSIVFSRKRNWAVAMGGAYMMPIGWDIATTTTTYLEDAGRLVHFMESTTLNEMAPNDALAFEGTEYVLASPNESYIIYSSNLKGNIGLKNMTAGSYDLTWYDPTDGTTIVQNNLTVSSGDQSWSKPAGIGNEVAVYITKAK
jgi:hypothetical protein